MEDLTLLLPLKVKVNNGKKAIISCPFCGSKHSVVPAVVKRFSLKDFEVTCRCKESFHVKFEVAKRSIHDFDVTVSNPLNDHTFRNINIQLLNKNHINFTCKEQLNIRKGQKLRVSISFPTPHIPHIQTNAIVKLVRGNFVSCFFTKSIDLF